MTESKDDLEIKKASNEKVSVFRRILPQVIATTVKNIHIIDLGLAMALPTIMIPSLTGIPNQHNRNEYLSISGAEASWIGSLGYMVQVFACLPSGFLTDPIGRKRAMILVNIPFAIGWLVLYNATAVWHIYVGIVTHGIAVGLMESSVISYLGEICEPSVRGVLIAFTNMCAIIGVFIVYTLNAWFSWRTVALICLTAPISSAILLCFIPETPHWLLSKHRTKQAEKSLQWLRGWVSPKAIAREFQELRRYSERSKSCNSCVKQQLHCLHPPPTLREKFAELKRKRTLKPFAIIVSLFFLAQFTGVWAMRPFIVQIFNAYESPIASDQNVMILGFVDNFANIIFICLLRFTGKRRFYLTVAFGVFLSSFAISCYGFINLPSGFNSFDRSNQTFHLEDPNLAFIPTICLYVWNFCAMCGFAGMPWMLLSELFNFRSRGIASGIAASLNYVIGFISKKTYYNLETTLSLPGISLFYSVICGAGLIFAYFILPETENRTLEDIELHFSDNSKKFTDRKILKSNNRNGFDGPKLSASNREDAQGVLLNQQLLNENEDA